MIRDKIEATVSVASALASHEGRYKCNGLHENYHYLHIVAKEAPPPTTSATSVAIPGSSLTTATAAEADEEGRRTIIRDVTTTMETKSTKRIWWREYTWEEGREEEYYDEEYVNPFGEAAVEDGDNGTEEINIPFNDNYDELGDNGTSSSTLAPMLEMITEATEMNGGADDGNSQFPSSSTKPAIDWQRNGTAIMDEVWEALTTTTEVTTSVVGTSADINLIRESNRRGGGIVRTARVDLEEDGNGNISAKEVLTWSWTGPIEVEAGRGMHLAINNTHQEQTPRLVHIIGSNYEERVGGRGGGGNVGGEKYSLLILLLSLSWIYSFETDF